MELDLSPKISQKVSAGDGGSYYSWSSAQFPLLSQAKLGAGKLILQPLGLALPHYGDSSKIGYVLQGTGRVGMVLSEASEEKVLKIKKGDAIPIPLGVVSWWFNDGDSELIVVFLGETSKALNPGDITYFLLEGAKGIFNGFSTEFVSRALDLEEEEANKVVKSQPAILIVKLKEGKNMPEPNKADVEEMVFNIDAALPDVNVKNGGRAVDLTSGKFPFLGEVGLSAALVKLHANAMYSPRYSSNSFQMIYIVRGSGHVQIVGIDGQRALDATVEAGQLFVVPRFFVVSEIASDEGIDWFSINTTQQPVFSQLVGKASVWKAISPKVVQVSLNKSPELEEHFRSKMSKNGIFLPAPPN